MLDQSEEELYWFMLFFNKGIALERLLVMTDLLVLWSLDWSAFELISGMDGLVKGFYLSRLVSDF